MIKRILISIIVISSLFFVILKCNKNKFTVNEMHICYVLDDGYTEPTLVSISSLIRHAKKGNKIALHIVDTGISEEGKVPGRVTLGITTLLTLTTKTIDLFL